MVTKYDTGLIKTLLLECLSEPEFYDVLVHKFRKQLYCMSLENLVGKPKFSDQATRLDISYNQKEYNTDVIKQFACVVDDPVKVDHFAYLFNCMRVGRGSDSVMARLKNDF